MILIEGNKKSVSHGVCYFFLNKVFSEGPAGAELN